MVDGSRAVNLAREVDLARSESYHITFDGVV